MRFMQSCPEARATQDGHRGRELNHALQHELFGQAYPAPPAPARARPPETWRVRGPAPARLQPPLVADTTGRVSVAGGMPRAPVPCHPAAVPRSKPYPTPEPPSSHSTASASSWKPWKRAMPRNTARPAACAAGGCAHASAPPHWSQQRRRWPRPTCARPRRLSAAPQSGLLACTSAPGNAFRRPDGGHTHPNRGWKKTLRCACFMHL